MDVENARCTRGKKLCPTKVAATKDADGRRARACADNGLLRTVDSEDEGIEVREKEH